MESKYTPQQWTDKLAEHSSSMPPGSDWASVSGHIISEVEKRKPRQRYGWIYFILLLLVIGGASYGIWTHERGQSVVEGNSTTGQEEKTADHEKSIQGIDEKLVVSRSTQLNPDAATARAEKNSNRSSNQNATPAVTNAPSAPQFVEEDQASFPAHSAEDEDELAQFEAQKITRDATASSSTSVVAESSDQDREISRSNGVAVFAVAQKQDGDDADKMTEAETTASKASTGVAEAHRSEVESMRPQLTLSALPIVMYDIEFSPAEPQLWVDLYKSDSEIEPAPIASRSPWSIALSAGLNSYRSHYGSASDESSELEVLTDARITLPSPSIQLGLRYEITDKIFVESGAMFSQLRQRVQYSSRLTETIDLPNHVVAIETNQFTGASRSIRADTSGIRITTRVLDVSSRQVALDIPLRLGYQLSTTKWNVGFSSGVSARWSLSQEGNTLTGKAEKRAQSDLSYTGIQWTWSSEASLNYELHPGLAIQGSAGYMKNLSSADRPQADAQENKASLMYAQIGLRLRL